MQETSGFFGFRYRIKSGEDSTSTIHAITRGDGKIGLGLEADRAATEPGVVNSYTVLLLVLFSALLVRSKTRAKQGVPLVRMFYPMKKKRKRA